MGMWLVGKGGIRQDLAGGKKDERGVLRKHYIV